MGVHWGAEGDSVKKEVSVGLSEVMLIILAYPQSFHFLDFLEILEDLLRIGDMGLENVVGRVSIQVVKHRLEVKEFIEIQFKHILSVYKT